MKVTKPIPALLALLLLAGLASAQDRKKLSPNEEEMYTVSAKVGVLNIVEGDVNYKRDQADWARLTAGDELRDGDAVKTGATGRTEILLTPGCYLRLAENSAFVLSNPHVYQFRIDLTSGSAIVEVSALDGPMTVATPKSEFTIVKEGLYRFNLTADGRAEVIVHKGRLMAGNAVVKEKKSVTVENGQPVVASFDKDRNDGFDLWSEGRARDLIALNNRLSQRGLSNNSLSFVSNAWVYSPSCGCYTFLPFGSGFSSPYGWGYSTCNPFGDFYSYYPTYWRSWGGGYNSGSTGSGTGSGTGGGTGGGTTGGGHHHKPGKDPGIGIPHPPIKVDGGGSRSDSSWRSDNGARNGSSASGGHHHGFSRTDGGPRYSAPSVSAPHMSAPSMSSSSSSSSSSGGGGHHHKN
jgi:FecR protein